MNRINYLHFRKEIEQTGKTFFTFSDLKKFYPYPLNSFKVLLSNWNRKKLICHLNRNIYTFDANRVDFLKLSNERVPNSYISFEYALHYHGLINQVPSTVTLATLEKSKLISMSKWVLEYSHIKKELFFGYVLKEGFFMATPEKSLADLLYLIALGKRLCDLDSLNVKKLNKKELRSILRRYPDFVRKKVRETLSV